MDYSATKTSTTCPLHPTSVLPLAGGLSRRWRLIFLALACLYLSSCAATNKICGGFTDWVEPARAAYFATNRVYDLTPEMRDLARQYQPQLVIHPQGTPPIDFADYLEGIDLVYVEGDLKGEVIADVQPQLLSQLSYQTMCQTYLRPAREEVVSAPPYPWYVQAYTSPAPHDPAEDWLYLKYNLVFDWSGLANELSTAAFIGANILTRDLGKWHRLDVHTNVIIAIDPQGRQRLAFISQHNYVKTYLAGRDFDPRQPLQLAAALRSNELYLDSGRGESANPAAGRLDAGAGAPNLLAAGGSGTAGAEAQAAGGGAGANNAGNAANGVNPAGADGPNPPAGEQEYRVVTFSRHLPYLIAGENPPAYHGWDLVAGRAAGGVPVPMRLEFIAGDEPLAAYAGLLAPPEQLFGRFYVGRDGPMGYDYYAPPQAIPMERLAALGYWQYGDAALASELATLIEASESNWWDAATMEMMIDRLAQDLKADLEAGL